MNVAIAVACCPFCAGSGEAFDPQTGEGPVCPSCGGGGDDALCAAEIAAWPFELTWTICICGTECATVSPEAAPKTCGECSEVMCSKCETWVGPAQYAHAGCCGDDDYGQSQT